MCFFFFPQFVVNYTISAMQPCSYQDMLHYYLLFLDPTLPDINASKNRDVPLYRKKVANRCKCANYNLSWVGEKCQTACCRNVCVRGRLTGRGAGKQVKRSRNFRVVRLTFSSLAYKVCVLPQRASRREFVRLGQPKIQFWVGLLMIHL